MNNTKKIHLLAVLVSLLGLLSSCETSYLDVVPDNLATIEDAFSMRTNAEKYLFTCYSYLPRHGSLTSDPAMMGADEIWGWDGIPSGATSRYFSHDMFDIAMGRQNKISPIGIGNWDGMYKAIRDCNIFLENIQSVPDMEELEKRQWISEALFLKAYYHFYLMKLYGPIPVIDESLPIDASIDEVRVSRNTVDECFGYINELIDSAIINLPLEISDPFNELGRITKPIGMTFKAEVKLYQASPLFNGNTDFGSLKNNDGTQLFNSTYNEELWVEAAQACKDAIDLVESLGGKLYVYPNTIGKDLSETILNQLNIRNSLCEKWNEEVIWGNTQSWAVDIQRFSFTHLDFTDRGNTEIRPEISAPIKITDLYYTENGVPINEDITWDYNGRYETKVAEEGDYPQIVEGYETAKYNFDREDRFYGSIGFDGGVWYGQGKYDESNLWHVECKFEQANNKIATGNFLKKLVHWENVQSTGKNYSINRYPWPVYRLADLYLMYAEAVNEAYGPTDEAKTYINKVRERAGLEGVDESWAAYSSNPTKPNSKEGLRAIIHQERGIELAFEGKRFWDIRRWKTAPTEMNATIEGWNLARPDAEGYSKPVAIYKQSFGLKDYFFPIKDSYIIRNPNLVQNLGW